MQYRLNGDLEDLAEGYEDWEGLIWLGLTPTDSDYRLGGVATSRKIWVHPHAVAQAEPDDTIPHEIGHTLGMHHTNCRDEGLDDLENTSLEDELPHGRTRNTGMDVYRVCTQSKNSGDLMSYCHPRWIAAPVWEYLRESIWEGA